MKNIVIIALSVVVSITAHINVKLWDQKCRMSEAAEILNNQLNDFQNSLIQLCNRPTYEQGVADGFSNRSDVRYTHGYHAAMEQMAASSNRSEMTINENN